MQFLKMLRALFVTFYTLYSLYNFYSFILTHYTHNVHILYFLYVRFMDVYTFNCDVTAAFWVADGNELTFHVSANRFLRNMVRAIVGTLVDVGLGKLSKEEFRSIIESKNRLNVCNKLTNHYLLLKLKID